MESDVAEGTLADAKDTVTNTIIAAKPRQTSNKNAGSTADDTVDCIAAITTHLATGAPSAASQLL